MPPNSAGPAAGDGEASKNFQNTTPLHTEPLPNAQAVARRMEPAVEAALALLCELFPKTFVRHEARRRPLKIGIRDDLRAALDGAITDAELRRALQVYCSNKVYRSRLSAGATRIDLNGQPAGTVSAEHALAPAKPTPKAKPKAARDDPSPPMPPPKRLSLQDLREAAQQRKAGGAP
jgi:hypothetical protein